MMRRFVAWLWGFSLFLPYPALPVGGNTGLQLGYLLMLMLAPLALLQYRKLGTAWGAFGCLVLPIVVNMFATGFSGRDINAGVLMTFVFLSLPVSALVFSTHPREFVSGVLAIMIVHGCAGLYQMYAFQNDEFPWEWLYVNPSFAEFDEESVEAMALYIKRPFGLMPEPSTMVGYTAPWVLLLIAALAERVRPGAGPLLRPTRWRIAGMVALMVTFVASTSGALPFFGAGLSLLILIYAWRIRGTRPIGALALIGMLVVVAVVAQIALTGRVESESSATGSWDERATSIRVGFQLLLEADPMQVLFGYGGAEVPRIADRRQSTAAVHSFLLTYVVAYGLIGVIGLLCLGALTVRAVAHMDDRPAWAIVMLTWVPGPLMVSGYYQILGTWALFAIPLVVLARQPRCLSLPPALPYVGSDRRATCVPPLPVMPSGE